MTGRAANILGRGASAREHETLAVLSKDRPEQVPVGTSGQAIERWLSEGDTVDLDPKPTMVGAGRASAACLTWLLCLAGCDVGMTASRAQLAALAKAGPVRPAVDLKAITRAKLRTGPYHVVVDDLLELHLPLIMHDVVTPKYQRAQPLLCRVGKAGTIRLPIVGEIKAAGMPLSEIEASVVSAYHPKYLRHLPSVAARVREYHTEKVSVLGAVNEPGAYELNSDEMSLVSALMKAGGIIPEGAGAIQIRRADASGDSEPLLLPVKGLNIPFADVALKGGDTIEVKSLDQQNFTVVGLVNEPGVFPYPPGVRYTLAHALAAAGGVDAGGDPQYVKICRQDASGRFLAVPFKIGGGALVGAANIPLKPGDVIAVEQTWGTEARRILMQLLRVSFGVHASYNL